MISANWIKNLELKNQERADSRPKKFEGSLQKFCEADIQGQQFEPSDGNETNSDPASFRHGCQRWVTMGPDCARMLEGQRRTQDCNPDKTIHRQNYTILY